MFISHAHLDHIAALPAYVSRRRMMKMDPPVIYLPDSAVDTAWDMLQMFRRLDRGAMPCELIGLLPGDETHVSREYVVTALPTRHTIDSLGFVVHQRRHKLKPEFQELDGDEIRDLKLSGTEVTQRNSHSDLRLHRRHRAARAWTTIRCSYESKILISEMTFVAPEHRKDKIHKHGHMHVDDYRDRADRFRKRTGDRRTLEHPIQRGSSRTVRRRRRCRTCWAVD